MSRSGLLNDKTVTSHCLGYWYRDCPRCRSDSCWSAPVCCYCCRCCCCCWYYYCCCATSPPPSPLLPNIPALPPGRTLSWGPAAGGQRPTAGKAPAAAETWQNDGGQPGRATRRRRPHPWPASQGHRSGTLESLARPPGDEKPRLRPTATWRRSRRCVRSGHRGPPTQAEGCRTHTWFTVPAEKG